MRARTVLVLLVLVVGLVAFIELYEGDLPSSEERAELDNRVFGDLMEEDVEALEIAWQGSVARIERRVIPGGSEDMWWLSEPSPARADSESVVSLIDALGGMEKTRTLSGTSRSEAGLEPPRLVVTVTSATGAVELEVGSEVPPGGSMIVAVGGETFVVDSGVWLDLAREPGQWRSRQVIHRSEDQITNIALDSDGSQIEFARRGPDFWITSPVEDRADANRVAELLSEVASMRIAAFVDEPEQSLVQMGIDPPTGVVEIWSETREASSRIRWGNVDPTAETRHFAEADGQVFATESNLQQFFDTPVEQWRSLELTSFETFQIDRLEVLEPTEGPLVLVREGADWQRNEDTISFTTVSDLLYALTQLQAESVLPDVTAESLESGPDGPALKVILSGSRGEQTAAFFAASNGGVFATSDDRRVALSVSDNEFAEVSAKLRAVRQAPSTKIGDDE